MLSRHIALYVATMLLALAVATASCSKETRSVDPALDGGGGEQDAAPGTEDEAPGWRLAWAVGAGGEGGTGDNTAFDVHVLPDGSSLIAGEFHQEIVFGEGTADEIAVDSHGGWNDAFLARLDPGGAPVWARGAGGGGDELEPVYFTEEGLEEPVTEFVSEWTVYFGRRYDGVPILGPSLGVRLSAAGQMAAFMKGWRDIVGVSGEPIEILSQAEIEEAKDPDLADSLELTLEACGYTEGRATLQPFPGVGCYYVYDNPAAAGTLNQELSEWINVAADGSISMWGEKAFYPEPESDEDDSALESDEDESSED